MNRWDLATKKWEPKHHDVLCSKHFEKKGGGGGGGRGEGRGGGGGERGGGGEENKEEKKKKKGWWMLHRSHTAEHSVWVQTHVYVCAGVHRVT